MAKAHTKFLLVEGKDDAHAVQGLVSHFVEWGSVERDWPVKIEQAGSDSELLRPSYVRNSLKVPGLEAVGIVVDANGGLDRRWASLRNTCAPLGLGPFPDRPPAEGFVVANVGGVRLGIWIMPDNRSDGMLETFLQYLVPAEDQRLWEHAKAASGEAKELGAPFKAVHEDKAHIHTWLAWQDPPGRPFGQALKARCLDPNSPAAQPFVDWFVRLFELAPTPNRSTPPA